MRERKASDERPFASGRPAIAANARTNARLRVPLAGSVLVHAALALLLSRGAARAPTEPEPFALATLDILEREAVLSGAPVIGAHVGAPTGANARSARTTQSDAALGMRPRSRSSARRHVRPHTAAPAAGQPAMPVGGSVPVEVTDLPTESVVTTGSASSIGAKTAKETGAARAARITANVVTGPAAGNPGGSPVRALDGGPTGSVRGAGAGDLSDVVVHPRPIHEVRSASLYPHVARQLGIEGTVKLSVGTDESGSVTTVAVIRPAGHGFDEAATKALRAFRFSPARTRDGRAVPFLFTYTYVFSLDD